MRSSQTLTLAPLLSCHWRYPASSCATLSEVDPIAATSRVGRGEKGLSPARGRDRTIRRLRGARATGLGSPLPVRTPILGQRPRRARHEIAPIPSLRSVLPLAARLYVAGPQAAARHRCPRSVHYISPGRAERTVRG